MPRKKGDRNIKNPLREGMPAKIYLLSFGGMLHAYRIADILKYGWETTEKRKKISPSKVYESITHFKDFYYKDIKNTNREKGRSRIPIKARVEPLISEIELEIEKTLTQETKKELHDFFDSEEFRLYIFECSKSKYLDYKKEIDAFEFIMNNTSYLARLSFLLKRRLERANISRQDYKRNWSSLFTKLEKRGITQPNVLTVISEYIPGDIKNKMMSSLKNPDIIINLAFKLFDMNYEGIETLMKMHSTYEANTIVEAGLMALPELIEMAKK